MLARRKLQLNTVAERVGITPQNLSVLNAGRARAIRFSTLEKLCEVLECQPAICWRLRAKRCERKPCGNRVVRLPVPFQCHTSRLSDT
jgi:hypothetical protein